VNSASFVAETAYLPEAGKLSASTKLLEFNQFFDRSDETGFELANHSKAVASCCSRDLAWHRTKRLSEGGCIA